MSKKPSRTTATLRDVLFDEIEEVRKPDGDPKRAGAVANLARQIIGTARIEMDFQRTMATLQAQGATVELGPLQLGSK